MKRLFVFILFLTSAGIPLQSQSNNGFTVNNNGIVEYSDVVEVAGFSQELLYSNCIEWFAETFKSANDVIQLKDKELGKIIGKGILTDKYSSNWHFTLAIEFKEEKFRYKLSDLYQVANGNTYTFEQLAFPKTMKKASLKRAQEIEEENIKPLIASLIKGISKEDDGW